MAKSMALPKIGVNMTEAVIAEWYIKAGDVIKEGDPILNAETDKATQDIYATDSGTVGKLVAEIGQTVQTQETILLLLEDGETVESLASAAAPAAAEVVDGYGMSNDENEAKKAAIASVAQTAAPSAAPSLNSRGKVRISPLAKKMAKDNGIDIALLSPAVAGARITKADVEAYIANPPVAVAPVAEKTAVAGGISVAAPKITLGENQEIIETIPVKGIRKVITTRMNQTNIEKPTVPLTTTVCVDELKKLAKSFKAADIKVGFNEMLIRIAARALTEHRIMNSVMSEEEIWLLKDINIGVAVDTEKGLMVPVVKNADHKTMMEISNDFRAKVDNIRDNNIAPDDMTGGTFTITNLGSLGVESFAPIINPPECGILGVGCITPTFVPDTEGNPVLKNMMKLTLVFDHRIVDGAPAARFLKRIKEYAENPQMLL